LFCSHCGRKLVGPAAAGQPPGACPACGSVTYRQPKVGAGVLLEQDGALLLLQRGHDSQAFPGTWNLPAGYCESGEPPSVTAAREAFEETGLRVLPGRLAGVYHFDDDPRGSGLLLVYEARISNGSLRLDGREAVSAAFFQPDRLPAPLCGGGHDQAIAEWRSRAQDRWQPGFPLRHCPHCTHPLEEGPAYGRVRPLCPACGFVHFRAPKVGVSLLVEDGERLLLVQRAVDPGLGRWCLPSGYIEWDESPAEAAARECAEETGLTVVDLELVDVCQYLDDVRGSGINITYRARVGGGTLRAGDDAADAGFFSPSELPASADCKFATHRQLLKRWSNDRVRPAKDLSR
jgi:ADP-ribose pyrophosphatase YjhB (NUDIX family)